MTKTTLILGSLLIGTFFTVGLSRSQDHHEHDGKHVESDSKNGTSITVVGEVIDPVCFIRHDSHGEKHKKCAEYCADQGITLGILEDGTGNIYTVFPEGHDNPNAKLKEYVADRIKVTGLLWEKGGLKGIEPQKIEKIK